ncbi:MAG: hypothetical protein PHH26_07140 [Candidatus Thermoplasmatota archaeon]|nr:hypothetical protein [Candidatus Thermoplasmatota archaeon]
MVQSYFEIKARREKWNKVLFYVDLGVLAVLIVSAVYMVIDAFYAGYYYGIYNYNTYGVFLWKMGRNAAFVIGSMAWIFYRLFTNLATARKMM